MRLSYPNPSFCDIALDDSQHNSIATMPSDIHGAESAGPPPLQSKMDKFQRLCMTIVALAGLMFSTLDTTIVSTALVKISVDFGNDYINAPWVVLAYLLTYMGFAVCIAKLSDIYGRGALAMVSWTLFSLSSLACGCARSMTQLIGFRAVQGIGGSGLYSLAQITLMEMGPRSRGTVGALIGMTLCISFILGPLLGGVISNYNWRLIFFINCPAGGLATWGWLLCWPGLRRVRGIRRALRKIDFLGSLLLVASSILLVYAVQQGGSLSMAWGDPAIVASFVISGTCFIAFWLWQIWVAGRGDLQIEPVFPIRLARRRRFMSSLITTFLVGFSYISLVINMPERFQIVNGQSPLLAGLRLLPLLCGCAFGSFICGFVASRMRCQFMLIVGATLQVFGTATLWGLAEDPDDVLAPCGYSVIFGIGVGICFAAATMTGTVESFGCLDLAPAQGALAQARMLGGSIGLAICTIIFNSHVQGELAAFLQPDALAAIHRSPLAVLSLPLSQQPLIKQIYMEAFQDQMLLMVCISAAAVVAALPSFTNRAVPISELMKRGQAKQLASPSLSDSNTNLTGANAPNCCCGADLANLEGMELVDLDGATASS